MIFTRSTPNSVNTDAEILFEYVKRYLQEAPSRIYCRDHVLRDLITRFPLLPYLFESETALRAAFEEIKDDSWIKCLSQLGDYRVPPTDNRAASEIESIIKERDPFTRIPLDDIQHIAASEEYDPNARFLSSWVCWRAGYRLRQAVPISRQYVAATHESWGDSREKKKLLQLLAQSCDLPTLAFDMDESKEQVALSLCSIEGLVPNRKVRLSVAILNSLIEPSCQVELITRVLDMHKSEVLLLIMLGSDTVGRELIIRKLHGQPMAYLDSEDIKYISVNTEPAAEFRRRVVKQLPLRLIIPYHFNGPVPADIFFGRKKELRRILEMPRTNYSVMGARKIGKSSLLMKLKSQVNDDRTLPDTVAVYVDASTSTRIESFQRNLMQSFDDQTAGKELREYAWVSPGKDFFEDFGNMLKRTGMKFLFLIDEADAALADQSEPWLERFARSLSNEGYARFVFSGYNILAERMSDRTSSFYNLFDPVPLGPLNDEDARQLVCEPMKRMEVSFASAELVDEIIRRGSTVPWLLQFMCNQLLHRLDRDHRRQVRSADVRAVYDSDEFSQQLTAPIDEDKNMPLLDRLIVYLVVNSPIEAPSEQELYEMVGRETYNARFSEIRRSLKYLTSTYIFRKSEDKYRFFIPQVRAKLRERERDLSFVIRALAEEYRASLL